VRRLFLLAFIWGWSFLFIKVAVEGLTPTTVAWTRIALGAAVLYAILRHQGGRIPVDRTSLRHYAVAATAGNIVPFTLLNASTPLFTAVFAAIGLSERLRPVQIAGLALGMAGVAVAAGLGASDLEGSSTAGALAAILAGAAYGIAFVYMRRHLVSYPPVVAATGQLATGAVMLFPLAALTSIVDGVSLTPTRSGAILALGVVGTGLAYVLNYRVIGELGPTKASLVTYVIPVVAVVVGIVVLDEPFEWRLVVGGLLTVGGIAAVNAKRPARERVPATVP
jgi:drug/metabolite transporter (DMT)-like permease